MGIFTTLATLGVGLPLAARVAPHAARGAKALWQLGRGLNTPEGRRRARRALWQKEGSIPRSPSGKFEAGSRSPGALNKAGAWYGKQSGLKKTGIGGAAVGGGVLLDTMLFGGQPPPEDDGSQGTRPPTMLRSLNNPWSPSKGLMSDRGAKRMQSETFWGNMNKMMQMSAILNASGGDTKGFQDMMSLANKKVLSEMGDQREMDIYDSVFQTGNMPNTAIEAYERVIASGGGSDRAAKIAGQYVKMRDVRVNDNAALTKLIQEVQALISNGDEAAAGARIHTALTFHEIPTDAFEDAIGNLLTGQALNDRIKEALKGMRSVNPG